MPLVHNSDITAVLGLSKAGFFGRIVGRLVIWMLRLDEINKIYDRYSSIEGISPFLGTLLDHFGVQYQINQAELKRIPQSGPVVVIANHPLGGIDGIILMHVLQQLRPDMKMMSNFMIQRIEPIKKWIIPVNPFDKKQSKRSSVGGFREVLRHLEHGGLVTIFPAGEVASKLKKQIPIDPDWNEATLRLIQRAKVPVVPVYFHARNSPLFYRLAQTHDLLRTAKLPPNCLPNEIALLTFVLEELLRLKTKTIIILHLITLLF